MSNSIERWKTNPEYIALADFLFEQTEQVKSPLNLRQLVRDFKEKTGSTQSNSCLKHRIVSFRENIAEMADLDTDTKVKLMFALSSPVDHGFLQELRKHAEVTVDSYHRITEHNRKDGGLHLIGKHHDAGLKINEKYTRLFDFLADKSKRAINPISDNSFLKEFIKKSGLSESIKTLEPRYQKLKKQIYELSTYDIKTRIRMMFVSGTKVFNYALEEIRKEAIVEVDQLNRMTKYEAKDGSLLLEGEHSVSYKRKATQAKNWRKALRKEATDDSDEDEESQNNVENNQNYQNNLADLVKFVGEKCLKSNRPLAIKQLCKEYKQIKESSESVHCLSKRVTCYGKMIPTIDHLDVNSKVRQCFGLSVSLQPEYLEKLRETAIVEVDEKQRIIRYEANNGSLQLQGVHSHSAKCAQRWAEIRKRKSTPHPLNDSDDTEDEETSSDSEETDGETTTVNRKLTNAAKKGRSVLRRSSHSNPGRKKANESQNQSSLKKRRSTKQAVLDDMSDEEEAETNDVIDTPDIADPRSEVDMDYDNDRMTPREDALNESEVPESNSSDESQNDDNFIQEVNSESIQKEDISELERIKNTEHRVPFLTSRRRRSVRIAAMESTVIDKSKDIQDTIHCQSKLDLNIGNCAKSSTKDVFNDPEESESSSSDDSDDDDENYTPGKKLILCETKRHRRCNTPRREVNITQNEVEIGRTRRTASVRPLLSSKTSKGNMNINSRSVAVPDDSFDDFIPHQSHFDRNTDFDDSVAKEDPKSEKSGMNTSGRPSSSDTLVANKNSEVEHQIVTGSNPRNNTEIEPIKRRNSSNQVPAPVTRRRVSIRIAAIHSVNLDNKTVVNSKENDSIKVPDPENNNAQVEQRKDPLSGIPEKKNNTLKIERVRRSNTPRRGIIVTQNEMEIGRKRKNITSETPSLTKKSKESLIVNGISEAEPERQQDFGLDAGVTSGCSNPKESQMSAIEDPNVEKESIDNHVPPPEVPSNEDSTNPSTTNVIPKEQIPIQITTSKDSDDDDIQIIEPERVKTEEGQETSNTEKEEHVSHHKLLNAFRVMLRALDLSVLARLQQTIEKKLKNDRNSNERVPMKGIILGLESCLHVLTKSAIMKPEGTSTSLNNVLLHLRSAVILIDSPTLNDFEQRLKEEIAKFSVKDMYIPVNDLQNSLNMAVYIFAPTKIP